MDQIANEANVDGFAIGPSSVAGRWLAVHVLLRGSIAGLRRRLLLLLASYLRRLRAAAGPLLALLRPSRTLGVLLSATLLAFLLRRCTDLRSRAVAAYRRRLLRKAMARAATYEEWAKSARKLERGVGSDDGGLYDEELVGHKLAELRRRRREGSVRDMAFYLRGDLVRNLGDMCNPQLHKGRLQVPKLISEYIEEVSSQLKMVCSSDDADGLLPEEKLTFVHETRHAFGRTALLLSGGACLGSFHVGVVRTLAKHKLLPRIIAGSSAGSIISAIASTRTDAELEGFFQSSLSTLRFFDALGGISDVARRIATKGAVYEIRQLQALLREVTGNATFREAYRLTGRILAVTVSSPRPHERPRCLNYLTAPHVLIWSAVTASCAFPGLFPAQELMAKNRRGEVVPYQPAFGEEAAAARRWRDGSLDNDLPMEQLRELFNVNHFIVSQANPHIVPILRLKEFVRGYLGDFAAKIAQLVELEVKNRCNQILELRLPVGAGLAKLFVQEWEGDVTIVMPATLSQYLKIIQNPTYSDLMKASEQGRRCTWEKLSAIRSNCAIELALDDCAARLAHSRAALKRHAASLRGTLQLARRLSVPPRIPSWNTLSATLDASDDEASRTPTPRSHLPASPQKGRLPWSPGDRGLPPRSPHATLPAEGEYALMERTSVGLIFDAAAKEELTPRGRGRGQ